MLFCGWLASGGHSCAHAVTLQDFDGAGGGTGGCGCGGGGGGISWQIAAFTADAADCGVTLQLRRPFTRLPRTVVARSAAIVKFTFHEHGHAGSSSTESSASSTRCTSMYCSEIAKIAKWCAEGAKSCSCGANAGNR